MRLSLAPRALGPLLAATLAGSSLLAQEHAPAAPEQKPRGQSSGYGDPPHALEVAIGSEGIGFAYRNGLHRGRGFESLGVFISEDDDVALSARMMRYGEPRADVPFGVGVGIGLFGVHVDEQDDDAMAITLSGGADYSLDQAFGLTYPTRVGVEVTWAPDIATFMDGQRVLEVLARVETDLSTWATGFVGYHRLEVDLQDEKDADLDSAFQIGVRLGF